MYKNLLTMILILVFCFLLGNSFASGTGVDLLTSEEKITVLDFLKKAKSSYEGFSQFGKDYEQVFVRIEISEEKRKIIIFSDIYKLIITSLYVDEVMDRVQGGSIIELAYEYASAIDAILIRRYSKERRFI